MDTLREFFLSESNVDALYYTLFVAFGVFFLDGIFRVFEYLCLQVKKFGGIKRYSLVLLSKVCMSLVETGLSFAQRIVNANRYLLDRDKEIWNYLFPKPKEHGPYRTSEAVVDSDFEKLLANIPPTPKKGDVIKIADIHKKISHLVPSPTCERCVQKVRCARSEPVEFEDCLYYWD